MLQGKKRTPRVISKYLQLFYRKIKFVQKKLYKGTGLGPSLCTPGAVEAYVDDFR